MILHNYFIYISQFKYIDTTDNLCRNNLSESTTTSRDKTQRKRRIKKTKSLKKIEKSHATQLQIIVWR